MHPVATDIICDFSNVVASVHNELWQPACGIVLGVVTTKLNIPGHKRSSQPQFAVCLSSADAAATTAAAVVLHKHSLRA